MRNYQEFAQELRREIDRAGLDRSELDLRPLDRFDRARARPFGLASAVTAAVLAVALGASVYGIWRGYDGRRLVAEQNILFVEAIVARGLFEAVPVPGITLESLADEPLFVSPGSLLHPGLPGAAD